MDSVILLDQDDSVEGTQRRAKFAERIFQSMQDRLPREVRDMIYNYVLDDMGGFAKWAPYATVAHRVRFLLGSSSGTQEDKHLRSPRFSTARTRLELNEIWWHTTYLSVGDLDHLSTLYTTLHTTCPWECEVRPSQLIRHAIVYLGRWSLTPEDSLTTPPTRSLRSLVGAEYTQEKCTLFTAWELRNLLQLSQGARVTLWFDYDDWELPAAGFLSVLKCLFPVLHELKGAGLRVQATLPGMFEWDADVLDIHKRMSAQLGFPEKYTVGIIGGDVEFSPTGWYRYAQAYMWSQRQIAHLLHEYSEEEDV